ncbi:DUF2334 domain-containing protein [Paludisphaera rhizosphaerae]|uniref:DUF2334 domain-containing protein n=1 Tax=Paludisphaera rhizosphaerae TaxID=2711216 RepID=UPI0013EDF0C8|nr:DUF2334 domain-containing protein [Paludisphaera rhizosphaerae]
MRGSDFEASASFALVIHDVAPVFRPQLEIIRNAVAPLVADRVSAAVVPCWHGCPLGESPGDVDFLDFVAQGFGEILLHGYTHQQDRPGLISYLSGRSNELSGLTENETRDRLAKGRERLGRLMSSPIAGFVAPAWRLGRASPEVLSDLGFEYVVGFGSGRFFSGPSIPLATWSWDWGILPGLGWLGERLGASARAVRPASLPCVVIHPLDVDRRWLPRCLRVVERLLAEGRTPTLFSEIVGTS